MSSKTKQVGCSGEFAVIKKLLEHECEVFRDVTDSCDADLVIRKQRKLYTVQVKTMSTAKNDTASIKLCKRRRGRGDIQYNGDEFDILAFHVLDRDATLYFRLPELLAMGNKAHVGIRFDDVTRKNQRSHVDFLSLDRCL